MILLFKKYAILVVSSIIIVRLITVSILTIWPDLLSMKMPDEGVRTFGIAFLETGVEYIINIIFVILLSKDMKRENIFSLPILILTFVSNILGVIFFFLILANNKLIQKQLD